MSCRAATTVVDGGKRYRSIGEEDRKSRYGEYKNVALSVEVQLDSQQPH